MACQDLRKFGICVGTLYFVQSITSSVVLIVNLNKYAQDKTTATQDGRPFDEDREIVSLLCIMVSLGFLFVLAAPFLIWGSIKAKFEFFLPWLYSSLVSIAVNSFYLFVNVLKYIYNFNRPTANNVNDGLMIPMLGFGLVSQCLLHTIVYDLYKRLKLNKQLEDLDNLETSSTNFSTREKNRQKQNADKENT